MRRVRFMGILMVSAWTFISCQKNDEGTSPSLATTLSATVAEIIGEQVGSLNSETEHGVAVAKFDGISDALVVGGFDVGNYGMPGYGISGIGHLKFSVPRVDSCATVTVSSDSYPKEIVVEYSGTCSDHRHHVKSGKIIISISDSLSKAGAVGTITYEDFYIDSMKIDLTATFKNLGMNSSGNWVIEKSFEQTLTKDDNVCVRENNETAEWISGFETAARSDNKYYLSGSGKVILNDTTYTKTITTPLLIDGSCEYRIVSGVVELTKNGSTAIIDYGDGTCDDKATVTIDGTTEEISLHSHNFREGGEFHRHHHGFGGH